MTKSQINRLGNRLRENPSDQNLITQLQDLRALYEPQMATAQRLIREHLGLQSTARLKTVNTIIEKLQRERTRLAEMHDIAGLRVVQDMTLGQQTSMSQRLVELFPAAKVIDRRETPNNGYRALHVIVRVEGRLVEIQLRTLLQDLWAQAMERLADEAGREARYGHVPGAYREQIESLQQASVLVAGIENLVEDRVSLDVTSPRQAPFGQRDLLIEQMKIKKLHADIERFAARVRQILDEMIATN